MLRNHVKEIILTQLGPGPRPSIQPVYRKPYQIGLILVTRPPKNYKVPEFIALKGDGAQSIVDHLYNPT